MFLQPVTGVGAGREGNIDRNATAYISGSGKVCLITFPNARHHQHAEKRKCDGNLLQENKPCTICQRLLYKIQWIPDFSNLRGKRKLVRKNRMVGEIGVKIIVFDWGEGNEFWFELSGGSNKWRFEKSEFHITLFSLHFCSPRVQSTFKEDSLYFIFLHLIYSSIWEWYFPVNWVITVLCCVFIRTFLFIVNKESFRHFLQFRFWS